MDGGISCIAGTILRRSDRCFVQRSMLEFLFYDRCISQQELSIEHHLPTYRVYLSTKRDKKTLHRLIEIWTFSFFLFLLFCFHLRASNQEMFYRCNKQLYYCTCTVPYCISLCNFSYYGNNIWNINTLYRTI